MIGALFVLALAASPTIDQCVASSTDAQREQKGGSYLAARRQLQVCADDACPPVIRSDCTKWLAEVIAATPSLVVVARLDGVDQTQARVLLDGHLWQAELTGRPDELEPGAHQLSVTVGSQTRAQELVVNVGEKNRLVVFEFNSALASSRAEVPVAASRPLPIVPILVSVVAVAGFATFTGVGLDGRGRLERLLAEPCAATKSCDVAAVEDIRRRFLIADVGLGIGLAGVALSIWQWWAWARQP